MDDETMVAYSFGDSEFAGNKREGKIIIQVRCKTHTLNEYFSNGNASIEYIIDNKKRLKTMKCKSMSCIETKETYKPHWFIYQLLQNLCIT